MSEPRIIRKYPNRRLYDTTESRYITLSDIRKLVVDRIEFVVIDKKNQEDITHSILLQVIAEQELGGEPIMSRDFLSHMIRSYSGGIMQGVVGSYLDQSLKLFAAQQGKIRDKTQDVSGTDNGEISSLAERNFQHWRTTQDNTQPHGATPDLADRPEAPHSPGSTNR
jgi:polyhydroxyalkanoate synthesis repressor PhaR